MKIKRLSFLIIGIILLLTFLTMAIFPQFFTSYNQKYSFEPWLPPSFSHILGTNSLGYDIFAELIYGARQTILISLTASLGSLIIGVIIGILASFDSIIGTFFNGIINIFQPCRFISMIRLSKQIIHVNIEIICNGFQCFQTWFPFSPFIHIDTTF